MENLAITYEISTMGSIFSTSLELRKPSAVKMRVNNIKFLDSVIYTIKTRLYINLYKKNVMS